MSTVVFVKSFFISVSFRQYRLQMILFVMRLGRTHVFFFHLLRYVILFQRFVSCNYATCYIII